MRIVSKKRDYYDCIQAQGQDQSLVYVRTEEVIDLSKRGFPFPRFFAESGTESLKTHIIGFCGKLYPLLQIYHPYRPGTTTVGMKESPNSMCYNIDDVDALIKSHYKSSQIEGYYSPKYTKNWPNGWRRTFFVEFFKHFKEPKVINSAQPWFDAKKSPIFVATYYRQNDLSIAYNTLLRYYNFMRIFDPPRAFQEIMMYMSNLGSPEKPIPQLSDADMAHSKGHGDKYSFRTAPGTKPGRKKNDYR